MRRDERWSSHLVHMHGLRKYKKVIQSDKEVLSHETQLSSKTLSE